LEPRPNVIGGMEDTPLKRPEGTTAEECGDLMIAVREDETFGVDMVSRWSPNDQERLEIAQGADILLHVFGGAHPPVWLSVRGFNLDEHLPVSEEDVAEALETALIYSGMLDMPEVTAALEEARRRLDHETGVRRCRVCGCTDTHSCPEGCWWVEEDLCSSCVGAETA